MAGAKIYGTCYWMMGRGGLGRGYRSMDGWAGFNTRYRLARSKGRKRDGRTVDEDMTFLSCRSAGIGVLDN